MARPILLWLVALLALTACETGGRSEGLDMVAAVEGADLSRCVGLTGGAFEDEILINHPVPFPQGESCAAVIREILTGLNFDESELTPLITNPQVIARDNQSGDLAVVSVPGAQGFRNIIISNPEKVADYERWNQNR